MSNSSPLVSIIVPVYNCEAYLTSLFDSLENQTFKDFEIICVDDGSTDRSLEILESRRAADSRITVISQPNGGGAEARNKGLSIARGKYVMLIDADDFCEPNMLELMTKPFDDNSVGMVVCDINIFWEDRKEYAPMPWAITDNIPVEISFRPQDIPNLFRDITGYVGNKMIRRSLIEKLGLSFQAIPSHDDLSFVYAAMAASDSIYYVDAELYHYRRRSDGSSVTDTTMVDLYEYAFIAIDDLRNYLFKMGKWDEFEQIFVNYTLYMCKWKTDIASGEKRDEIRNSLRDHWFKLLGVLGHEKAFYLDEDEYNFLCCTLNYEFIDRLIRQNDILQSKLDDAQNQLKKIRSSHSFRIGHALTAIPRNARRLFRF